MHSFPVFLPILLYLALAILGITIGIYLIFFLRTAIRYLELRIQEIEHKSGS